MKTKDRIAKRACQLYYKQMQNGKLMRCAKPKEIAERMQAYLGIKCGYDNCYVWIE